LVKDFDADAWLHTGRGAIIPAQLALHILLGIQYYLKIKQLFNTPQENHLTQTGRPSKQMIWQI
jgi:hypothetical protein